MCLWLCAVAVRCGCVLWVCLCGCVLWLCAVDVSLWLCVCDCVFVVVFVVLFLVVMCLWLCVVVVLWLCVVFVCCGCAGVDPKKHVHPGQQSHRKPLRTRARLRTCLYITSLTGLLTHNLYYLYLRGSTTSIADRSELTETTPQQKQCAHMFQAVRPAAGARTCVRQRCCGKTHDAEG